MNDIEMAGPWITQHEIDTVLDAVSNGWYGPDKYYYCEQLQKEFAKYHGRKYGIMTPNCTTSIHLLLTALGIEDDDEVIVPECTWIASAAGVTYLRAKTIFCDIEPDNWCLSPDSAIEKITDKTKAIIAVNLFGNMARMDLLEKICLEKDIYLIEDAAESLGSKYQGHRSGSFGVGSVFSFHRTKTMTTGEGGMLLLDDDDLYERCTFLRDHGRSKDKLYYNDEVTYKYMPFNLQAALGYAQFQRLDELVDRKREQLHFYKNELSDIEDLHFNQESPDVYNSAWITGLVFGKTHNINKEQAMSRLEKLGVPSRPFFYPLSSLPAYNSIGSTNEIAYDISSRGINLPGAANLKKKHLKFVCDGVRTLLGR